MRKTTKILITALFPLVLVAYPLSILLPVETAEIENRAIEPPELDFARMTSYSMYSELLSYVRSANPLRALMIRSAANLDFRFFDDSPDPSRVLKGRDGWLYYRPTLENGCGEEPETVVENVKDLIQRIESAGGTVVFTVAPSKFVIHPESLMDAQERLGSCAREAGARLRRDLASNPLPNYVDGWQLFEDVKAMGTQPYFKTDTHFNFVGSIPWMEALIGNISDIWDPRHVEHSGSTLWLGNLTSFMGLDTPEEVEDVTLDRGVTVTETFVEERMSSYQNTGDVALIYGKTLILGDSFMDLPRSSIIQFFEDVTTVDWRDADGMDYFLQNATSSDTIIIEVSELDIWDRFRDKTLFEDLIVPADIGHSP